MKYLYISILFFLLPYTAKACDICGCGAGSNYIGLLPEFQKKVIGLRHRYNSLQTHIGVGGAITHLTTLEKYRITEVWGGWNFHRNWRLMATLPYSYNEKLNQGKKQAQQGLGDMNWMVYHQLFNNRSAVNEKLLVQSLWLGVGMKMATGKYERNTSVSQGSDLNIFQLGTGSNDVLMQMMYDVRYNDWGMNIAGGYKLNTPNRFDYWYGNRMSWSTQLYHKFRLKNQFGFAPNIGLNYERSKKDEDDGLTMMSTGGSLMLGTVGVETNFKRINFGGNYQHPLKQDLGSGMAKVNSRWMVHIAWGF